MQALYLLQALYLCMLTIEMTLMLMGVLHAALLVCVHYTRMRCVYSGWCEQDADY
jgi:hypothetical protein